MTGLLFGTTLLAVGIALGFWIGRKSGPFAERSSSSSPLDPQQFLAMVRSIAAWTNDIAGDVSEYQSEMHRLAREAKEKSGVGNRAELHPILDQIVSANDQLQKRLEVAEQKLETQTNQLEDYLAEARTDALTGLANRRAFDHRMDELHAKHQRTHHPVSLALIDVDHFKSINDTYGHAAGDVVLKQLASVLRSYAGQCDLVARYGGEEFGMIFSIPREQAAVILERLRAQVAFDPVLTDGQSIPVTISVGVSQLASGERLGDLFRHSDEALYSAKQGGRNRVVVHAGRPGGTSGRPSLMRTETTASSRTSPKGSGIETRSGNDPASAVIDALETRVLVELNALVEEESAR
jgi:diguanylate cyclase